MHDHDLPTIHRSSQSGTRARVGGGSPRSFGLIGGVAILAGGGGAGILGAALLSSPSAATATTWIVDSLGDGVGTAAHCTPPTAGTCTLRDALAAQASGDTIAFDASLNGGTINLTAAQGQLLVDHKAVTITGPGADLLTINQTVSNNPVFYIVAYEYNVVISGLKITGGTDSGIAAYGVTDLTLDDVELTGNTAVKGGGLYLDLIYGDLSITNSYIHGNTSTGEGGGIYVPATASRVPGPGDVLISGTIISNNDSGARGGGGILRNSESVTIEDSTFSGNDSSNGGGALYIFSDADPVVITGSTFDSNTAFYQGGAILASTANLTINNSTFTANTGMGGGGLSALHGSSLTVNQSTFTGNTATGADNDYFGGGGINFRGTVSVSMSGTIVSANSAAVAGQADIGFVDDGRVTTGTINSTNSLLGDIDSRITLLGSGNIRSSAPGLGVLAANGGPTRTMALLLGSPAIDAGPDPVAVFVGNQFDQRGIGYPRIVGATADIGAFEFVPEPEPTTTSTSTTSTSSTSSTAPATTVTTVSTDDLVLPQFTG